MTSALNQPVPWQWPSFGLSVMDRYILSELVMPFLFGVVAFSSIGVSVGAAFDLVRRVTEFGLSPAIAAQIFLLRLPYFVSLALPTSMLLSCLMVYGRLSSDSELVALRSCGVSLYRLVAPAIALSLVMTAVTFAFNEAVVPAANRQSALMLDRALKKREPTFTESNIVYQEFRTQKNAEGDTERLLSRIFYAKEYDGRQMKGLTILDFTKPDFNQIIVSKTAVWNGQEEIWDFFDGTIYVVNADSSYRNIVRFQQQQIQLPRTPLDIVKTNRDSAEMNIAQAIQYRDLIGQTGNRKEIRKIVLRIDQKIAFPFACLVFGLAGATLGIQPRRAGRATGFGLSLVIIISYYLLISTGEALYQFDILTSFMASWLPTIVGLLLGGFLLVRLSR
jgi:lipopolysaccharide export system permease protein